MSAIERLTAAAEGESRVRFHPLLFAVFLLLCLVSNYPGRLNEDSVEQLIGAANRALLNDHHSPIVGFLWNLPSFALGQPAGALLVQSVLLAFYAAVIPATRPRGARGRASMTLEVLFKLSLVITAGMILKDVFLIGVLLSALAAFQLARSSARPRAWAAVSAALWALALLVRPTNFLMLAIACALCLPLFVRSARQYVVTLAAASVLLALTVPFYAALNRWVFRASPAHMEINLILFDVAGVSMRTGQDLFARLARWPTGELPPVAECYTPTGMTSFAPSGPCPGYLEAVQRRASARGSRGLIILWVRSVATHPIAYLGHRAAFARNLLDSHRVTDASRAAFRAKAYRHYYALNGPERVEDLRRALRGRVAMDEFARWESNAATHVFAALRALLFNYRWTDLASLLVCLSVAGWIGLRAKRHAPVDLPAAFAAAIGIGNVGMQMVFGIASQSRYLMPTLCCAAFALIAALRFRTVSPPIGRGRSSTARSSD